MGSTNIKAFADNATEMATEAHYTAQRNDGFRVDTSYTPALLNRALRKVSYVAQALAEWVVGPTYGNQADFSDTQTVPDMTAALHAALSGLAGGLSLHYASIANGATYTRPSVPCIVVLSVTGCAGTGDSSCTVSFDHQYRFRAYCSSDTSTPVGSLARCITRDTRDFYDPLVNAETFVGFGMSPTNTMTVTILFTSTLAQVINTPPA